MEINFKLFNHYKNEICKKSDALGNDENLIFDLIPICFLFIVVQTTYFLYFISNNVLPKEKIN